MELLTRKTYFTFQKNININDVFYLQKEAKGIPKV